MVELVKKSGVAEYSEEVIEQIESAGGAKGFRSARTKAAMDADADEMLDAAIEVVVETGQASVSMLQRQAQAGVFPRLPASWIEMEERGIVGAFEGAKPRQVLVIQGAVAGNQKCAGRAMSKMSERFLAHDCRSGTWTELGWKEYDFLCITGDAYVDHPSFGSAIITRVLEAAGYRVAVLSQPDWRDGQCVPEVGAAAAGGLLITGGNIDSMVAHYTAPEAPPQRGRLHPRRARMGARPDRAAIVYSNRVRARVSATCRCPSAAWRRPCAGLPTMTTGTTRYAARSCSTPGADLLVYGMAESTMRGFGGSRWLRESPSPRLRELHDGICFTKDARDCAFPVYHLPLLRTGSGG